VNPEKSAWDISKQVVSSFHDSLASGDVDGVLDAIDLGLLAASAVDEGVWNQLSEDQRKRMVDIITSALRAVVQESSDDYKTIQYRAHDAHILEREGVVPCIWRSMGNETKVLLKIKKDMETWKIVDIQIPSTGFVLSESISECVQERISDEEGLEGLLQRDSEHAMDWAMDLKRAFHGLSAVEMSILGKIVKIESDPSCSYEVIKQEKRDDSFWVLVRPQGDALGQPQWVEKASVKVVNEDADLWGKTIP